MSVLGAKRKCAKRPEMPPMIRNGQRGGRPNDDCLKLEPRGESHVFLDSECGCTDRLSFGSTPTGYLAGKLLKGTTLNHPVTFTRALLQLRGCPLEERRLGVAVTAVSRCLAQVLTAVR